MTDSRVFKTNFLKSKIAKSFYLLAPAPLYVAGVVKLWEFCGFTAGLGGALGFVVAATFCLFGIVSIWGDYG